ncbi:phenylacetate--CoA ligase family protein [Megalodesulfovibrio paquesii]
MVASPRSTPRFIPEVTAESLRETQTRGLDWTLHHAWQGSPVYQAKLRDAGWQPGQRLSLDELSRLPFTSVEDLRQGYPLPLLSIPEEQVVRVHASSGTTGKRKVLAYSAQDILTWKEMFARCYELAGLTVLDRVQICVGYGLWTAGAGFQLGCEHFGAMAVPVGPGNLEMQLTLLEDFRSTCLCSTASMALLLGEAVEKQGLRDKIALKRCIFGAETHSPAMRQAFEEKLGLEESFDIAGLTELYGPGTGLECQAHEGIHFWADKFILEILDPATLKPVAPGEVGEMVVTTLCKEAAPLIRYRTRDLTRLLPESCACGCSMPRHDRIRGRSDDMIIYRGVNVYPGQIAEVLGRFADCSSEYRIVLERHMGKDVMRVEVERATCGTADADLALAEQVGTALHKALLARVQVKLVDPGSLPRSFGKSKRVLDERGE